MDIKSEGKKLLSTHAELYNNLSNIPSEREIEFHNEFEGERWFGKPRYKQPKFQWDEQLFIELRDHLQEIWNFFERYNYWLDETVLPLIESGSRRTSKKSIIFLLENDVWNTTEVYGKYLIEKGVEKTIISYYRFATKIKETSIDIVEDKHIGEWICNDAITQIKKQFKSLWSRLETEINVCIKEEYTKKPRVYLTNEYLKEQYKIIKYNLKDWPEASLLCLGRICELWLLSLLKKKHKNYHESLINHAKKEGLIDKNQVILLFKVKSNYDYLKHKLYYQIDAGLVNELINQFSKFFVRLP